MPLRFLCALLLGGSLLVPLSASAFRLSFGGRLVSQPIPCFHMPGFFQVVIRPAGRFSPFYVWGPGTLGLPPVHIGQQILGLYDALLVCNGVPSFRIQYDGISI